MTQKLQLPENWVLATNDDLGEFINGFAFKPADRTEHGTPIIRIQNLTDPLRPFNYTLKEVDQKYVVERGDILVSWSATLDAFRWNGPRAYVNQHIFKVVPSKQLNDRFVFFALKETINELTKSEHLHGTTMKHVNRKPFLAHPVGLPPLNEQHRIVEGIETLFARIDKGEEALREVQKLLKRYRQSILKAAVTGELTRDWREANQHKLEPASEFLSRLLETRDRNWQGARKPGKPSPPVLQAMPEIPCHWEWASLDSLCVDGPTNGISPRAGNSETGIKSFKLTATTSGEFVINEETIKLVDLDLDRESKYWLRSGDILIQRGNTIEYVGTAAIFPGPDKEFIYPDLMIKVRIGDPALAKWVVTWINTFYAREYFKRNATGTAGNMPKINGRTLKTLAVPIPSIQEIRFLLEQLDQKLSKARTLERQLEQDSLRVKSLRQSILKSAFTGQLVPQDPDDEPASELLARIRAEREAPPKAKSRRKARA